MTVPDPEWLQTATKKRQLRDQAIQTFAETLQTPSKLPLDGSGTFNDQSRLSAGAIPQTISSGVFNASTILEYHIRRLTEILFDDATKQANELDKFFKTHGRLVGPLHGIPMTVKDQFDIAGYDSTLGYVGRAFKPAAQDCVLVAMLKQMGAVIFAKTNLPQSIMWCETENPLWGLTTHPKNPDFTPGGSTGGEGTLLSLGGTAVGWGTDIGGSIRIPSHMNGLYGFKPSSSRLPYHGVAVSTEGQEHVPSVIGPMSRDMESLIVATQAVIDGAPWNLDPKCCPVPWRSTIFEGVQSRPLVIAVMRDDGVVRPHPPVTRVLEEVVAKLKQAGHEIVPWTPGSLHQECIDIMDQYYTADGGEDIRRDMEEGGEPYIPHVEALVNRGKPISVYSYWQLNRQKLAAQKRFLDLWNSTKSPESGKQIDIMLAPVMPHSAVPHRTCRWVGYTKIFNFVDYPSVVLPAGQVSKELDTAAAGQMGTYQPRNPLDEWNWNLFDVDSMDGMPIGVQVITCRLQEEKALGAAKSIDKILRGLT
ncbi:amidase [Dothidotthia symphoricarpi CBS 119687]|uniref:Amidase n=1 Tax=Dothidotthia symphoricarpi CBS 119687 TaxID=1392245 RepID=A0A6A6APT1_9PLEO|nr:amidase [Dothidotthia symphoricarpi CBS 119687]KAF2133025.1 amidase [Dothidotthia symphoricarpi CBS 119687]